MLWENCGLIAGARNANPDSSNLLLIVDLSPDALASEDFWSQLLLVCGSRNTINKIKR